MVTAGEHREQHRAGEWLRGLHEQQFATVYPQRDIVEQADIDRAVTRYARGPGSVRMRDRQ